MTRPSGSTTSWVQRREMTATGGCKRRLSLMHMVRKGNWARSSLSNPQTIIRGVCCLGRLMDPLTSVPGAPRSRGYMSHTFPTPSVPGGSGNGRENESHMALLLSSSRADRQFLEGISDPSFPLLLSMWGRCLRTRLMWPSPHSQ